MWVGDNEALCFRWYMGLTVFKWKDKGKQTKHHLFKTLIKNINQLLNFNQILR